MTDLPSYRAEPDAEFADRLERELLRLLTDPAVSRLTEVPLVTDVAETDADDVSERDLEAADRRRRPSRIHLVAGGLMAAGLVALLALVGRNSPESQPAVAPPAANGLIAFVGESDDNPAKSDIYVVEPDGSGLRALTSTPELVEYAPAWSPDGSRLAFVRTANDEFSLSSPPCRTDCQVVVVDPSTGAETFSADIPDRASVPQSLAWSPDGRAIVISSSPCGIGGCGPTESEIADLETGAFTTFTPPYQAMWSSDGEWLSLVNNSDAPVPPLLLVPADLIGTGNVVHIAELPGVRPLPEPTGEEDCCSTVDWMPDGSAMVVSEFVSDSALIADEGEGEAWIDVVTVPDGTRRPLIEDGFDPVVSPDGSQIAYSHERAPSGIKEIWVAAADGSDPRPVTDSFTTPTWSPDGSLLLASDGEGWFTVRPDGTDRTPLGIQDHTPRFQGYVPDVYFEGLISGTVDWQPLLVIGR